MEPNIELVVGEEMRLCIECDLGEHSMGLVLEAHDEALKIQELLGLVKLAGSMLPLRLRRAPGGVWEQLYHLPPLIVENAPLASPGPDSGPVEPGQALQAALAAKGGTAASLLIEEAQQFAAEVMEEQGLPEEEIERKKWDLHINNKSSINTPDDFARRVRQGVIAALGKADRPLGAADVAREIGVSEPTARKRLQQMVSDGEVIVVKSWMAGKMRRSLYGLTNGKKSARP